MGVVVPDAAASSERTIVLEAELPLSDDAGDELGQGPRPTEKNPLPTTPPRPPRVDAASDCVVI